MAEKDITTWEEFKAALYELPTETTTYHIKNDIDVTHDILIQSITCRSAGADYIEKIFDGDGHKITGITAYGNFVVFSTNQALQYRFQFVNIMFTNIMIESGTFTNFVRSTYYQQEESWSKLFVNCFFSGVCKTFIASATSNRTTCLKNCSVNLRCENFSPAHVVSCYVILQPLQKVCTVGGGWRNSYLGGKIAGDFSASVFLTPSTDQNSANVFNAAIVINNYSASVAYKTRAVTGNNTSVLTNKDKIFQADGVTPVTNVSVGTGNNYLLTDTQLKDKNYIQQNTNFPLYG